MRPQYAANTQPIRQSRRPASAACPAGSGSTPVLHWPCITLGLACANRTFAQPPPCAQAAWILRPFLPLHLRLRHACLHYWHDNAICAGRHRRTSQGRSSRGLPDCARVSHTLQTAWQAPCCPLQHTASGTRHTAHGTRHTAPSTQHPAPSTQHPAPSTQPSLRMALAR